jgi:DNA repair exonuclease SbcCD ATPase subunit
MEKRPSKIIMTSIKKGNFKDASQKESDRLHIPSIEEIKLAIKSNGSLIQNKPFVSNEFLENSNDQIKSIIYSNYYNKYDFKEITISKDSDDLYYFLVHIEYI